MRAILVVVVVVIAAVVVILGRQTPISLGIGPPSRQSSPNVNRDSLSAARLRKKWQILL